MTTIAPSEPGYYWARRSSEPGQDFPWLAVMGSKPPYLTCQIIRIFDGLIEHVDGYPEGWEFSDRLPDPVARIADILRCG